jgi:hypothetical protein
MGLEEHEVGSEWQLLRETEIKEGGWGWGIKKIMEEGAKTERGNNPMYYFIYFLNLLVKGLLLDKIFCFFLTQFYQHSLVEAVPNLLKIRHRKGVTHTHICMKLCCMGGVINFFSNPQKFAIISSKSCPTLYWCIQGAQSYSYV